MKKSVLAAFLIKEEANQLLLKSLEKAVWKTAPPPGKGRSIAVIAAPLHNVRRLWERARRRNPLD